MIALSLIFDLFFNSFYELSITYHGPTPKLSSTKYVNVVLIETNFIDNFFVSFANAFQRFRDAIFYLAIEQGFAVFNGCYHMIAYLIYAMRSFA